MGLKWRLRMIIVKRNEVAKVPILLDGTFNKIILTRDSEKYELPFTQTSAFYGSATIPGNIPLGEWSYDLGGNLGIIRVEKEEEDYKTEYNNKTEIVEYVKY